MEETLRLLHRWGYAPRLEDLAQQLIGGPAPVDEVSAAARSSTAVRVQGEFVALADHEAMLGASEVRSRRNSVLNGGARSVARAYAHELARLCPFVQAVALSGSVASGGYTDGDDVDFDLFVEDGTKYTVYLIANLLGLRYNLRYHGRPDSPQHRVLFLRKVICINVVWPDAETRPFRRQDAALALELLRCEPLIGTERFARALADNEWIDAFLPQARVRRWVTDPAPLPSRGSKLLTRLYAKPRAKRVLERLSRFVSYLMYRAIQGFRNRDEAARKRMEFLRRAKYPYEVFQD